MQPSWAAPPHVAKIGAGKGMSFASFRRFCRVDGDVEGEVTIHIDDKELSLAEFGRMLRVHAGWGMRIAFVPEEFISENPKVEIRKPKRRKR